MSTHVRRGGLDVQPPPWLCPMARASVFALSVQPGALQSLCDRVLNTPSGGRLRFQPVLDTVVLTFQDLDGLHASGPYADQPITHRYNEACFWVMVQNANDPASPARLLVPYIFADNGLAVAAGRECYGYPKELAEIDLPAPGQPGSVLALAAPQLAPGQPSVRAAQLIDCRGVGLMPFKAETLQQAPALETVALNLKLGYQEGFMQVLAAFFDMILNQRLAFVFLRQIRALAGGSGCDLQQVVAAQARVFDAGLPGYAGLFRLRFPTFASHPIASDLGLRLDAADQSTLALGGHIDFGFELGAGQVL